jgi:dTDP-4-dehydrorhamnose 3,5-epimerase
VPVDFEPLAIAGAWRAVSQIFADERGAFQEWFRPDQLEAATGYRFVARQANESMSRRGVLRGIHYADVPPGQAKWVRCTAGRVLDVVADLRVGSPTFGQVDSVVLDADDPQPTAVVIAEGLGHGFCAISETATVSYLVSSVYQPSIEREVDAFDKDLAIAWPLDPDELVRSPKDAEAMSCQAARAAGLLPDWATCRELLGALP